MKENFEWRKSSYAIDFTTSWGKFWISSKNTSLKNELYFTPNSAVLDFSIIESIRFCNRNSQKWIIYFVHFKLNFLKIVIDILKDFQISNIFTSDFLRGGERCQKHWFYKINGYSSTFFGTLIFTSKLCWSSILKVREV